MLHRRGVRVLLIGLLILVAIPGSLLLLRPKTGYCFEAAFDTERERVLVAAGWLGLHLIDVAPSGSLHHTGVFQGEDYYRNLEIVGDRAYIASSHEGLVVLDISRDPPQTLWSQMDSHAYGLYIQDEIAYVAAQADGVNIFDLSNPDQPQWLGNCPDLENAWDLWVHEGYAYVADNHHGLGIIDVLSPTDPQWVSSLTWDPEDSIAEIIDGTDRMVYIAAGDQGLIGVDVSIPTDPQIVYRYQPHLSTKGEGLRVWESILYATLGDHEHPDLNGLHIFDLTDPQSPVLVNIVPFTDWMEGVTLSGELLAVANTHSGVLLYHLEDPFHPILIGQYPPAFWRPLLQWVR